MQRTEVQIHIYFSLNGGVEIATYGTFHFLHTSKYFALLYLDLTLTCKAVCCAIFNKLHHHIFLSCKLTQGGAPCDEAAH